MNRRSVIALLLAGFAALAYAPQARGAQRGPESMAKDSKKQSKPFRWGIISTRLPEQTMLALDMNGERLPLEYGAPCRLRCEKVLGYKMVKYLRSIEFVTDFRSIGLGRGGGREDMRLFANYPTI